MLGQNLDALNSKWSSHGKDSFVYIPSLISENQVKSHRKLVVSSQDNLPIRLYRELFHLYRSLNIGYSDDIDLWWELTHTISAIMMIELPGCCLTYPASYTAMLTLLPFAAGNENLSAIGGHLIDSLE